MDRPRKANALLLEELGLAFPTVQSDFLMGGAANAGLFPQNIQLVPSQQAASGLARWPFGYGYLRVNGESRSNINLGTGYVHLYLDLNEEKGFCAFFASRQ